MLDLSVSVLQSVLEMLVFLRAALVRIYRMKVLYGHFGVTSLGMYIVQHLVLCSWVKDVKIFPLSYYQSKCHGNGEPHVHESTDVSVTSGAHGILKRTRRGREG